MTQTKRNWNDGAEAMAENNPTNDLIKENDLYLQQHAHDPILWSIWDDEAFALAEYDKRLVFLCLGYADSETSQILARTCFQDPELAEILWQDYVPVLVDADTRQDIDFVYREICLTANGKINYPIIAILTPAQEPAYIAAYDVNESWVQPEGMRNLLKKLAEEWHTAPQIVVQNARILADRARQNWNQPSTKEIDDANIHQAFQSFKQEYDAAMGGFGQTSKYPLPGRLLFLLRYSEEYDNAEALDMAEKTLDAMYRGGIYDQLAGGFFRLSTDSDWLLPQFEKPLSINALLAMVYLEAYRLTRKSVYAEVAEDTLEWLLSDLISPQGAYFKAQAQNLDNPGYFTWTEAEIDAVLGAERMRFNRTYGVTPEGNFMGQNILNMIATPDAANAHQYLRPQRKDLLKVRDQRKGLFINDLISTGDNGLMVAALAEGALILGKPDYLDAARTAARFILHQHRRTDGRLLGSSRDGQTRHLGVASDYASLIFGLIEMYEAGAEEQYLTHAVELTKNMISLFWEEENDGFYFYGKDAEELQRRPKDIHDGEMPSSNAMAAMNLVRLARMTGDIKFEDWAHRLFRAFSTDIEESPAVSSFWLLARIYDLHRPMPDSAKRSPKRDEEPTGAEQNLPFIEVLPTEIIEDKAHAGLAGRPANQ